MVLIFVLILGASVVGNVLLYQQNMHLMVLLDSITKDNENLTQTVAELNSNSKPVKPTTTVEKELLESNVASMEKKQEDAGNTSVEQSSEKRQSINAVGVRPLIVRDGFFERTQYEGTIMKIIVSIRDHGEGLVLVNTEVPTGINFQESAKTAVHVAQDYLDADLSNKDIIYSITVDADRTQLQAVDGHSAGAAMAVLLISEIQDKTISDDIVITGSILSDASIGMVGGIFDKAEAAGKYGAKIFLVPANQDVTQVESCDESRTGNFIYRSCTLEEKPLSPITQEMFDMKVTEVANINEAIRYFQTELLHDDNEGDF